MEEGSDDLTSPLFQTIKAYKYFFLFVSILIRIQKISLVSSDKLNVESDSI